MNLLIWSEKSSPSRRWDVGLFHLPFLILFPTSLLFLIMDQMLANATQGRDNWNYDDVTRLGAVAAPFILFTFVGSIALIAALIGYIWKCWKTRRPNWAAVVWIALGVAAHLFVMARVWDLVERWIRG